MQLLLEEKLELGGDAALAKFLGVRRPHVSKLLRGKLPLTDRIISQLRK